jgi:NTP pyrophosphatase (non-canonical NTP hydrolase)
MTDQVDLAKYQQFVERVTSEESNDVSNFVRRVKNLSNNSEVFVNVPLLLTAAIGMAAEGGEFAEIPKKMLFQGKPLDADTVFHMKRELGDIMWYWVNACRALGLDPNDVIAENVRKLESRYPGGEFDVRSSENRAPGDL